MQIRFHTSEHTGKHSPLIPNLPTTFYFKSKNDKCPQIHFAIMWISVFFYRYWDD